MFAKTIIDSDAFLDMPLSSQALYFHLSMRADDDGFINNPRKVQRMVGSSEDDLKLLMVKRFILAFDSGVIVIKHWKLHNYIRNDRYKPTLYQDEKAQLIEKDNKVYSKSNDGIPDGYQMDTQVRLGKDRLGKDRKDITPSQPKATPTRHKYGEYKNVLMSDQELEKLKSEFPSDWQKRIENVSEYCAASGKTYKNYLAVIRKWAKKDNANKNDGANQRKQTFNNKRTRSESYVAMQFEVFIREKQFDSELTITEYGKRKKLKPEELEELKQYISKQGASN
ncbi:replisome organizer [Enterococcus avium]|uniref:replisome organizer n=1 Tax=Enterococcus avium TaxID=33945 RepID=UPI00288CD5FE|nr:replisome organizer [Enterococcus avium]MDT2385480.1 replisome organizer [Enterococcus avium]MDT2496655.1 replisome organizer [Enterococcus avium]